MKRWNLIIMLAVWTAVFQAKEASAQREITVTVLYDNYRFTEGTTPDWGFACLIEGAEKTILFDTGTNGDILMHNAEILNKDPGKIDCIVLSHEHRDHTGGLDSVLTRVNNVPVYFPVSFSESFSRHILDLKSIPVRVDKPAEICPRIFTTGEISGPVNEQSLIIETKPGLVVITGCSHPGIVKILRRTGDVVPEKPIYLVFGGFHLIRNSEAQIREIIGQFESLHVVKCGATHCTGDEAIRLFREAYQDHYWPMGTGRMIHIPFESQNMHPAE
ncbi:MBL fold metallo-hydrolase [bacterium]|nr:MBL fold metallo-hydrolase [bacterium]